MTFDFSTIEEVRLGKGGHASASEGLCFMEMAAWFAGEKHSDRPDCACPVLGAYGIRLNDAMPDDLRDRLLKPLVPMIVGTRDKASEIKRAGFLAMWAVNKVLPIILREIGFNEHASACEQAKTLVEARAAADAAWNGAAYAARAARAAAYAAAYAARAADAAWNGAAYAARAARAAGDAAAYAFASVINPSAVKIWQVATEGLRQAILIGRHDGFADPVPVIVERREKLRELVGRVPHFSGRSNP